MATAAERAEEVAAAIAELRLVTRRLEAVTDRLDLVTRSDEVHDEDPPPRDT